MNDIHIRKVSHENLIDIQSIKTNKTLSKEERIKDFMKQIKNPYYFKVDDVIVSVNFSDNGVTFEEKLKQFLNTL